MDRITQDRDDLRGVVADLKQTITQQAEVIRSQREGYRELIKHIHEVSGE